MVAGGSEHPQGVVLAQGPVQRHGEEHGQPFVRGVPFRQTREVEGDRCGVVTEAETRFGVQLGGVERQLRTPSPFEDQPGVLAESLVRLAAPGGARLGQAGVRGPEITGREQARGRPRPVRSAAMSRLSEAVLAHLEEEDRSLFGLLAAHMTAADQRPGPAWSRATIPPADERRVLAMMLAVAGEDERARLFAASRDPVVAAWSGTEARALIEVHRVLAAVAARRPAGTTPQSAPPVPARSRSRHEGEPSETR
jgi:hypothetical protein